MKKHFDGFYDTKMPILLDSGRYAMQAMKHMEPQMKQAMQSFPKSVRLYGLKHVLASTRHNEWH